MRRCAEILVLATLGTFPIAVRAHLPGGAEPLEILPANVLPSPAGVPASGSDFSLQSIPAYHSNPSAFAKLYLDFDGDNNPFWNGYTPGITPAYDVDGDATTFSSTELANISEICQRVGEKYSPFNIDVTNEYPGDLNPRHVMKVVVGGDGSNGRTDGAGNKLYWAGGKYGGISWVGSFQGGLPNIAYVFSSNLSSANPGVPKYVGEASSHEAGHGFGLVHQSDYIGTSKINEYSFGTYVFDPDRAAQGLPQLPQPGSKSPTMGNSYYADRGIWWSGPTNYGFNQIQNDLTIIALSSNGFGMRPDGPNNSFATATPLTIDGSGFYAASGVIETMSDKDYFTFTTEGGLVSFLVNIAPYGATLDATASIYTTDGQLIAQSATPSLRELVAASLTAGTYELVVSSAGGYGDLGQYFITGAMGAIVPEPAIGATLALGLLLARRRRA